MNARHTPPGPLGFTRMGLLAIIAALAFVCLVGAEMPHRPAANAVACFNNLRQIGRAAQSWGNDHADRFPWITPVTDGGTQPVPIGGKTAVAWVEFISFSNELAGPQVFACPSDRATKVASHWGNTANGFANSGFRGNALSYFVNYHGQPDMPQSVVSGDRDFPPSGPPTSCSRGIINGLQILRPASPTVWTNAVHIQAGHLLFTDGSIEYVGSARLHNALVGPGASDNGVIHFINAR